MHVDRDYINATREAEQGIGTCRACQKKGAFVDFIAVQYGGGLLYALCLECVTKGVQVVIRRSERGIEVLQRARGPVSVASLDSRGPLVKRSA